MQTINDNNDSKSAAAKLLEVSNLLNKVRETLDSIEWTPAECGDDAAGRHVTALEQHLDNALGRSATLRNRVRLLARRQP